MRILFYFFWPYGIVAPPRIDPRLQWKCRVLTTGLPGRSSVRILDLSLYISRFTLPCLNPERWWKRKNLCASLCSVLCFAQIHIPWVSDVICLILCRPLLLLPPVFPSIRVFSSESALHIRWPEYQSFSISPSNKYSGLISFRIDWFGLLAVQGTLKSLVQKQFESISSLALSRLYGPSPRIHAWLLEKP